jgi:peptide/nickel transport system substrate-binding protein
MLEALSMVEGVQPVIFPKSVLDRYPGDKDRVNEKDVIGTGPFKFVSWERDRRIVLERFDKYAARKEPLSGFAGNKTAYFDRVHHNFVPEAAGRVAGALTGRYDLAMLLPLDQMAQIKGSSAVVAQVNPYGGRTEITFNTTIAPFDKKAMRQAVAAVLEPEEMLAAIAPKGLYTLNSSPFFPNQATWVSKIGYDTYAKRDLAKAKELILSAGLTPPVAIQVISVPVSLPGGRQIQVAVQQLDESKLFKVDLQIMDWTVMVQKRWEKKHSAMYNAFNVWYQNDLVAPTWNNPQHPASGFFVSPARDELLERRLQTTSAAEIAKIRDDFHRWFWDEVPLFPFGNFATLNTVGPHVKGSQHIGSPIYFGVWFDGKK